MAVPSAFITRISAELTTSSWSSYLVNPIALPSGDQWAKSSESGESGDVS